MTFFSVLTIIVLLVAVAILNAVLTYYSRSNPDMNSKSLNLILMEIDLKIHKNKREKNLEVYNVPMQDYCFNFWHAIFHNHEKCIVGGSKTEEIINHLKNRGYKVTVRDKEDDFGDVYLILSVSR